MITERKTVGIWIRVSTEDQANGDSPEHHEERARYYCKLKGWDISTIYHLEAVSGKSVMEQPETVRMMNDIKNGRISGLVFSKLARLCRNTKELLTFAEYFQEHGADLVSLQEAIDTSTPAGRLFYTMIAAMAQWEREEIASRVAASVPVRARLGKTTGGAAAYGFRWDKGNSNLLVIDETEAPIRKLMYEVFAKTRRKKATATYLNKQGYRTRSGGLFTDTTVDRLIRDPSAKGLRRANYTKSRGNKKHWDIKPTSEWVMVECPRIVSDDLWNQCNQILADMGAGRKKFGKQSDYLLAGFLNCGCTNKLYVTHGDQKYRCRKCNNKISVKEIDQIFKNVLRNFLFTDEEVETYRTSTIEQANNKQALLNVMRSESKATDDKLNRLVSMRIDGELSKEDFSRHYDPVKQRADELKSSISILQLEIAALQNHASSADKIVAGAKDLYSQWDDLDFQDRRAIVECITESVLIENQDVIIKLSYLPQGFLSSNSGHRQRNYRDS